MYHKIPQISSSDRNSTRTNRSDGEIESSKSANSNPIIVGISRSTLYEELKRGTVTQMNRDLTIREEYFAETGQIVYEKNRQNCRKPFKIAKVEEFVKYAEEKILKEHLSPDSVVGWMGGKKNIFGFFD